MSKVIQFFVLFLLSFAPANTPSTLFAMDQDPRLHTASNSVIPYVTSHLLPYKTPVEDNSNTAAGTISAVRILSDGWRAEVDLQGFKSGGTYNFGIDANNSPNNPRISFQVRSQGYDANGNLGTIHRTIYGTKFVRLPFPQQALRNETESPDKVTLTIALSDFVYSDDKNGGIGTSGVDPTVTILSGFYLNNGPQGDGTSNLFVEDLRVSNSSSLAYPKVVGRWAWPGYERTQNNQLLEAVAFHRFARNGKPVAAVSFTAQDQSGTSTSSITTEMTISSRTGDANPVLVYAATLPMLSLRQGQVIQYNFRAYPWVGDESSVLDTGIGADGVAQPDERLGPLIGINDKDGTYGSGFARVSSSGSDSNGIIYASQMASESGNAFLTIEKAAEALKTYHRINYGRDDAGAGTIILDNGNYAFPGGPTIDLGVMSSWLIIKPSSNASKASTVIASSSGQSIKASRLKIEGLTLATNAPNLITGRISTDALWLDNNVLKLRSPASVWNFKTAYATHNELSVFKNPTGFRFVTYNATTPYALIRGNRADLWSGGSFYAVLGNRNISAHNFSETNSGVGQVSDNSIYAFNSVYSLAGHNGMGIASLSTIRHGVAMVQNVFESVSTINEAMMYVCGGNGVGAPCNHIILWHNTFVAARTGMAYSYNTVGSTPILKDNWSQRFNIYREYGVKTDTFTDTTTSGNKTGNWSVIYNLGSYGNLIQQNSFSGEFDGINTVANRSSSAEIPADFVNEKSGDTNASGNGDYTLKGTSRAVDTGTFLPDLNRVLPFDLAGNPRIGPSDAGAFEYQTQSNSIPSSAPQNLKLRGTPSRPLS